MSKRVYISADYSTSDGDRDVIDELHKWGKDNLHRVDYCDTALVAKGSVSNNPDCRPCDLKDEFNKQINASSAVIFVIGDKTKDRTAGSTCRRQSDGAFCSCTPYKQNANGLSYCKVVNIPTSYYDVNPVNNYSYLRHEFEQAKKKGKTIIIAYNSLYKQSSWLPWYMSAYADKAQPFWIKNVWGNKVGNYAFIKKALGYE
jgi:hypothetical protein